MASRTLGLFIFLVTLTATVILCIGFAPTRWLKKDFVLGVPGEQLMKDKPQLRALFTNSMLKMMVANPGLLEKLKTANKTELNSMFTSIMSKPQMIESLRNMNMSVSKFMNISEKITRKLQASPQLLTILRSMSGAMLEAIAKQYDIPSGLIKLLKASNITAPELLSILSKIRKHPEFLTLLKKTSSDTLRSLIKKISEPGFMMALNKMTPNTAIMGWLQTLPLTNMTALNMTKFDVKVSSNLGLYKSCKEKTLVAMNQTSYDCNSKGSRDWQKYAFGLAVMALVGALVDTIMSLLAVVKKSLKENEFFRFAIVVVNFFTAGFALGPVLLNNLNKRIQVKPPLPDIIDYDLDWGLYVTAVGACFFALLILLNAMALAHTRNSDKVEEISEYNMAYTTTSKSISS